jgi:hypothetical protein
VRSIDKADGNCPAGARLGEEFRMLNRQGSAVGKANVESLERPGLVELS